jgi:hypothetical protein
MTDSREPIKFHSEDDLASLALFAPPIEKLSIEREALALLASLEDYAECAEQAVAGMVDNKLFTRCNP